MQVWRATQANLAGHGPVMSSVRPKYHMRKNLIFLGVVLAVAAVGTYLYFDGREYVFRFTEPQLQEKLAERLPIRKTYLFIFEVVLDNPRLSLINGTDRVNAEIDAALNVFINDMPLSLGGELDVSGGVRYDQIDGQFFLTDPVIENLNIQGIPGRYSERANNVLTKALGEYYADRPIYTLRETDAKQAVAKLLLKDVIVQNRELVVTLGI